MWKNKSMAQSSDFFRNTAKNFTLNILGERLKNALVKKILFVAQSSRPESIAHRPTQFTSQKVIAFVAPQYPQ